MPQYSRPDADVSAGSWVTTPLFSKVDEDTANVADSISSEVLVLAGSTSSADLGLASLTDPATSVGHVLRVHYKATFTLGSAATGTAQLRQGGVLIATLSASLTTAFATYEGTLTAAEADAITDYGALFVRFSGTFGVGNLGSVQVAWVEFEVPLLPLTDAHRRRR